MFLKDSVCKIPTMFADINLIKRSHVVGIQDNANNPGKFLIKELISSNASDSDIHVFCYDQYYRNLQTELTILNSSSIHFHDCFPNETLIDPLASFLSSLSTLDGNFRKIIVVIYSLSTLLLMKDCGDVYRMLRRPISMSEKNCKAQVQIFAFIHDDTLFNRHENLKHFQHLCRVWLNVGPSSLKVTIRKTSGKVLTQKYEYELTENDVKFIKKSENVPTNKSEENAENLPSSTFKINLSESEKKARDAVHLPYERNEYVKNVGTGGEIFYEPDEFDDWDEEDPDNDLEFS